ncbi:MAG: hypothetical protein LBM75_03575 [Myxococcales bacterium]|jgi:hypothetical protein|nr:hypothetical protein [Myxococcales bacterium]
MSQALSWIAVVLAATALIVAFMAGPSGPPASSRGEVSARDIHSIRDRLDALESSFAQLEARADDRGAMPGAARSALAPAPSSMSGADTRTLSTQISALRRDVDRLLSTNPSTSSEGREQFKSAVASAQHEILATRFRQHQERMNADRLERLDRFAVEQGLSSGQADDLRRVLEENMRTMQENMQAMWSGEGRMEPHERRQLLEAQRESLQNAVNQILSPEQAQKFEQEIVPPARSLRGPPPPPMAMEP